MMDYAVKLSADAASMTDSDAKRLRDFGFSDREIADITLAAAARNFFSRAVLAMGVDLDIPEGVSKELQNALLATLPQMQGKAEEGTAPANAAPEIL